MSYTIQHIAQILSAKSILPNASVSIEYLATDSRRISFPSSTLFFALQTERRDAHVFINELYERGVQNFIVRAGYDTSEYNNVNFIFTDNTLHALQQLAAYHRAQFNYPVIGITGSNGKTIVKEWLYQLLSPDYNIVRSPRSYNSQVGVPLSVWQMGDEHTLAIFEAGISQPNEMEALQKIIEPSIGLFTNIGEAHREHFKDLSQKAAEKAILFRDCPVILFSADDTIIKHELDDLEGAHQFFTWGKGVKAQIEVTNVEKRAHQTEIFFIQNKEQSSFLIPFTNEAAVQNALSCLTVLLYLQIPLQFIRERMAVLHTVNMRLQLVHAINNCIVINDAYSFDVSSFAVALDFLVQQQQQSQRTVIISDIPAAHNSETYEEVAGMLQAKNIHRVISIGEQWSIYQSFLFNKIPITEHFTNTSSFIDHFSANHFRNETILLKGGRVFGFEKIVALLERKVHQTVMEINLNAIVHNLNAYRNQLRKEVKLMAMVKAFAYGSGSAEVASLLQYHKADYFAVAYADEGVELRKAGISIPIMVMNVDEAAFETIVQYNLEPELFSFSIFKAFISFLEEEGLKQYPVHIKLDTGMHRLGFEAHDLPELLPLLRNNHYITVKSVFSHLAASEDAAEDNFTQQQAARFDYCCKQIRETLHYNFLMHIANSAGVARNSHLQYDMVRLGIGLYGVDSSNEQTLQLHTVATLKTTIAQIRKVAAGESIGYNRRSITKRDSIIATIRIGYADGFRRELSAGIGKVYINGIFAPVIGSIAMDMAMVDITAQPDIKEGDEVEIFGKHIPVQQVAEWCGTIPYEIFTGISQRVKRVYVEE